jgi:hypothetical protein
LRVARDLALHPLALGVQKIAHVAQVDDEAIDLCHRRAGNPVEQRIDVGDGLAGFRLRTAQMGNVAADELPDLAFEFARRIGVVSEFSDARCCCVHDCCPRYRAGPELPVPSTGRLRHAIQAACGRVRGKIGLSLDSLRRICRIGVAFLGMACGGRLEQGSGMSACGAWPVPTSPPAPPRPRRKSQ